MVPPVWPDLEVAVVLYAGLLAARSADLGFAGRALGGNAAAGGTLALLAAMGVMQIALPYALFNASLRQVGGVEASLLTLIEPVLNPVWVALLIGKRPSRATLLGGALILLALALRYTLAGGRGVRSGRGAQPVRRSRSAPGPTAPEGARSAAGADG